MSGIPIISSLVGASKAKPAAPPPAATPSPASNAAELNAAAEAERRARGRASNILTGGAGLDGGSSGASTVLLSS